MCPSRISLLRSIGHQLHGRILHCRNRCRMTNEQPVFPLKDSIQPVDECRCQGDEDIAVNGKFWCQYHQCRKTAQWHVLCQTRDGYRKLWNEGRGPGQSKVGPRKVQKPGLGDRVHSLLGTFGITPERYVEVKKLFGLPPTCGCAARRDWLNRVGRWLQGDNDGNQD